MSKVKIITLSTVHVGSGKFLHYNTDYVEAKQSDGSILYVIDPNKILNLIGSEHVTNWVSAIERNDDTKEFIRTYSPHATPDMYAERSITNFADIKIGDTLKEAIHDGRGVPYIPGSSIKGAFRTAVLATMANKLPNLESLVCRTNDRGQYKIDAQQVEKNLFGKDPNCDIFRFLKVGDAYFTKGCEVSSRVVNLNIRDKKDTLFDASKPQIVEAIGVDVCSNFHLKLDTYTYNWAKEQKSGEAIGQLPEEMKSLETLFNTVNQHTIRLLEEEISFWNEQSRTKKGAEQYIEQIKDILHQSRSCIPDKECVLRLGHASGWRFITGAWTETLPSFNHVIVPKARPKNDIYSQYPFPKSRRIDEEDGYVFGFVKLSLQ